MPPKRQVHWWTTQERHVVFILYTEFNQSNDECSQLFCHHFGHLFPTAPGAERIRDEFASRYEEGRSKMWERQIERTTYTQQQETERTQARRLIQIAAQATRIPLRPVGGGVVPTQPAPAPAAASGPPTFTAITNNDDNNDDDSSTLSSPPASPGAQSVSAPQGVVANDEEAGSNSHKRKRAVEDEGNKTEAMIDEDSDQENWTPQPAVGSRSGLVRTPALTSKSKKTRGSSKNSRSAKKVRTTRQAIREEDMNRNARPGFPEKYGHVYRHELEPNSRLLKLLDRHHTMNFWKYEAAVKNTTEKMANAGEEQGDGEISKELPVQQTPLLRQTADRAAETLFARVRASQFANGTITEDQPIQIFKPAAATTLAAAEQDLDEDEDVVMLDDE